VRLIELGTGITTSEPTREANGTSAATLPETRVGLVPGWLTGGAALEHLPLKRAAPSPLRAGSLGGIGAVLPHGDWSPLTNPVVRSRLLASAACGQAMACGNWCAA